jgi:hypothetical protein
MNYLQLLPAFDSSCYVHLYNGMKKSIHNIKPGEIIQSSNHSNDFSIVKNVVRIVIDIDTQNNRKYPYVSLVNFNSGLKCTHNQLILDEGKWTKATRIKKNIRKKMDYICPVLYSIITENNKSIMINDYKCKSWQKSIPSQHVNNNNIITIHASNISVIDNELYVSY